MKRSVLRVGALGAGLVALALLAWWLRSAEAPPARSGSEVVDSPSARPTAPIPAPEPARIASAAAPESTPQSDWFKAFAAPDLYPVAQAFLASRQRGGYGAARSIFLHCMEADLETKSATIHPQLNPLRGQENGANYGERLKARDRIQRKCDALVAIYVEPLPDDDEGQAFLQAVKLLVNMNNARGIQEAVLEAAAQGHLAEMAAKPLRTAKTWNGESWRDRAEIFEAALDLAVLRATSIPGMESEDLRLLRACYLRGACHVGYAIEAVTSRTFDAEARDAILNLATDMEAAFRRGDVKPFLRDLKPWFVDFVPQPPLRSASSSG